MTFCKLINGNLIYAESRYIKHEGKIYTNPTEETYRSVGYKPLEFDDYPEMKQGFYIVKKYEETDDKITIHYDYAEIPKDEEDAISDMTEDIETVNINDLESGD